MNNNKLNEEMFECKFYITDLETNKNSKEKDIQDLIFDDYIEFEFGDYEDEDYLQLPYNDFKFFINDYSVTFYSPQYYKLQSNWNSLRECIEKQREHYSYFKDTRYRTFLSNLLDKMNELEGNTYEEN